MPEELRAGDVEAAWQLVTRARVDDGWQPRCACELERERERDITPIQP